MKPIEEIKQRELVIDRLNIQILHQEYMINHLMKTCPHKNQIKVVEVWGNGELELLKSKCTDCGQDGYV